MTTKKPLAFISGASSGIGQATAISLANQGYNLLLMARREERLLALEADFKKKHPQTKVFLFSGDVRSVGEIQEMIQRHQEILGDLAVIINNAGLAKGVETFQEAKLEDMDQMLDTNIKGLIYLTRLLLPFLMQKNHGHIVNIGSVAGRWVYPGGAIYCASKFAVRAITEGLRQDLCGSRIRVTNIEPGMVETEFSLVRLGDQDKADAVYEAMTPLKPEDIAETISWSLSRPPHVNIQEIVIFPTDQAAIRQVHRQ